MIDVKAKFKVPSWLEGLTDMPKTITARAMARVRNEFEERARENVGSKGPRFLKVKSGELLRSIRVDLKSSGLKSDLTLRAARHGLIWENRKDRPRKWASDAREKATSQFPRFLREELTEALKERGGKA